MSKWHKWSMRVIRDFIIIKLLGGEIMMAMLMAQRVILEKMTFAEVPKLLKPQVKEILIESGMGFLAEE